MCDCAGQLAVLDDGTAAHALDNAAGELQESWVGDFQDDALVFAGGVVVDFLDFDGVILHFAGDGTAE